MSKNIKKITDLMLVAGFLGFIFVMPMMSCVSHTALVIKNAKEDPEYLPKKFESLSNKFENFSKKLEKILSMRLQGKNDHSDLKNKTVVAEQSQTPIEDVGFSFKTSGGFEKKIEGAIQNRLYKKYDFINLNGAVARCLGINSLNERQKLANGFLAEFYDAQDTDGAVPKVIALNEFLANRRIPFIYIFVPRKNSFYDVQFAPGYGDDSRQDITNMIGALSLAGIKTINMGIWFKENGWHMEDVFFKTDHHWKPEAALIGTRCTMELLQKEEIVGYDEKTLLDENYDKKVLKDWFLGSPGRRTGIYYGGVDDITVYCPKFKTKNSFSLLRNGTTTWKYCDSLFDSELAEKRNFFGSDAYSLYLYPDCALRIISNPLATNKKRVLALGDSFFKPWLYFLATQFQEIHAVDLRHYKDGTFLQYLEEIKPDVLIMCLSSLTGAFYEYGLESYLTALAQTDPASPVQNFGDFELRAGENNDKFVGVCGNLEANQAYTLTVDRTAMSGAEHSFLQMTLQNLSTNRAIFNRYFESNSGARQKWIFTTPVRDDAYGIFLYAGTKGHTSGIDAKVEGVALRKGIFED